MGEVLQDRGDDFGGQAAGRFFFRHSTTGVVLDQFAAEDSFAEVVGQIFDSPMTVARGQDLALSVVERHGLVQSVRDTRSSCGLRSCETRRQRAFADFDRERRCRVMQVDRRCRETAKERLG